MNLLVASRNKHKLEEISAIFNMPDIVLVSANEIPGLPEVVEDGASFHANAVKKAVTLAMFSRMWTIADDSGLEVDALGGAPGIHSARYAGEPVDYAANNAKLLKEMESITLRSARFWCIISLSSPSGRAQIVEGKCEGRIINEMRGREGFGFDPLFVPDGYDHTFAEMKSDLKNMISHRALAMRLAKERWSFVLDGGENDWPCIMSPEQRAKRRRHAD
ncbi:MAG: RdgB/HAM1 family non-canonical purine NTP pyrophosphatase [Kiritimatiellia bacterium]|nr:RdgB/HAM1 family non-canonical purine NTP pyrophosphatase [Kiritimatiellia bacterium]